MKYAKFGLILTSAFVVSSCDENSLSKMPEAFSVYANASETQAELIAVKQKLKETEQRLQSSLAANAKHAQYLQQERNHLQNDSVTLKNAMNEVQQLKQQVARQDRYLLDLNTVLSATEGEMAAFSSKGANRLSANGQASALAKQQKKPVPALKSAIPPVTQKTKAPNLQELQKLQQQKQVEQLRLAQQKKRERLATIKAQRQQAQQAKMRKQKQAEQQARILQQKQAEQQARMQQQKQTAQQPKEQNSTIQQLQSQRLTQQQQLLLQQRIKQQQAMQRLNKAEPVKKLEQLSLQN